MSAQIDVIGLGPGPARYLTLETRDFLLSGKPVFLRTSVHPTVVELKHWDCRYSSFDTLYEQAQDFELLYEQIVSILFREAKAHQNIVYAVPGNPLVAESTVTLLLKAAKKQNVNVLIHSAVSCIDVIFEALRIDPTDGVHFVDGLSLELSQLHMDQPMLITQVYSQAVATEVKLLLLERLDPEFRIAVVSAAGCPQQRIEWISVEDLDRLNWIDHLTSVWVPAAPPEQQAPLAHLRHVVARLRDPESGCPWDLKQTPQSLRKFVLEEAYEVVQALDENDPQKIIEELGDLLLQVFLQAQVAQDQDEFDLDEVADGIAKKLIYRHPHVFGDLKVRNEEDVKRNWEILKAKEKGLTEDDSILAHLTWALPALTLSEKISKKVAQVGFDWPEAEGVWNKIDEEYQELKKACEDHDLEAIFYELGDVLFTVVNLARWYKLDPEDALRQTNHRFVNRFKAMERLLKRRPLNEISASEWELLWNQAKVEIG